MGTWDSYCALCSGPLENIRPRVGPNRAYDPHLIREVEWLERVRCLGFNDGTNKLVKQAAPYDNVEVLIVSIQGIHLWLLGALGACELELLIRTICQVVLNIESNNGINAGMYAPDTRKWYV